MKLLRIISPHCAVLQVSRNKFIELDQRSCPQWIVFNVSWRWTRNIDHAGLSFTLEVYRLFSFSIRLYDKRHWDDENNRWETWE